MLRTAYAKESYSHKTILDIILLLLINKIKTNILFKEKASYMSKKFTKSKNQMKTNLEINI